ncbi:MAG: P1 family peptidase [Theionarchaea archaeon]|nr:P1 family peptidase [Theionarchaea archaeon]
MKAPDYGISIGDFPTGKTNSICDVDGVCVGHTTVKRGDGQLIQGKGPVRTGVTAILPHEDNLYYEKVLANACVLNGYAKPCGLIQVFELGVIETPIVLTNTLSVGVAMDAVIHYMLRENPEIGVSTGSVNPLVLECNDSYLNDIRGRHITSSHVLEAITSAGREFKEGAVGAGTGMSAFEFKGGIGSSSRLVSVSDHALTVGALVLSNFGKREDLIIDGVKAGKLLENFPGRNPPLREEGSIIMVVATDAPLTSLQLGRVARRAVMGLARTGGNAYNGSGDVVVAFSTAQRIPHEATPFLHLEAIPDGSVNPLFKATAESVEEAILNSLLQSETTAGRDGRIRYSLPIDELSSLLPGI